MGGKLPPARLEPLQSLQRHWVTVLPARVPVLPAWPGGGVHMSAPLPPSGAGPTPRSRRRGSAGEPGPGGARQKCLLGMAQKCLLGMAQKCLLGMARHTSALVPILAGAFIVVENSLSRDPARRRLADP